MKFTSLMARFVARMATEAFLIRHGIWDECDGEPMNAYAEEFERRQQLTRGAA
jgi:hypothetical protein